MGLLIRGGHLVDAATGTEKIADLYVKDGIIREIGENLKAKEMTDSVIRAEGCYVLPGLVDLHVHFRDPGQEYKEDLHTGSLAAARGGVTTVVAMPNTVPVIDRPELVRAVQEKARRVSGIHILQAGAITKGEAGKELSDISGMAAAGIPALSEDGKSVMDSGLCKKAMRLAAEYDIPVFAHCEDIHLRGDGCMNDDENARRLGLPGISNSVEDVIAARDILLALETGARLHLCHCSTEGTVRMMEQVRAMGKQDQITAEVCPHHFTLSSDDIPGNDPDYKMNPPLRAKKDVEALREGLKNGLIRVISTDHAPHSREDKGTSMRTAAFGIVGIETSFALAYTELVEKGVLTMMELVEKMCWNPAQILGIPAGTLKEGHPADIVVADTREEYLIDREQFLSKGRNTPFHGRRVKGKILCTICGGEVVYRDPAFSL